LPLFDRKLRHSPGRYIFQCLCAAFTVFIALFVIDATTKTTIIAVIGASSFIVFTAPNSYAARKRGIVGGYAIGILVGVAGSLLDNNFFGGSFWNVDTSIIIGAVAVAISIFLMVILDCEHPPAAGLSLAFLLNTWDWHDVLYIMIIAGFLALVKHFLGSHLKDLV